jgi:diketogulonate reductase-like aldo/keto reductase
MLSPHQHLTIIFSGMMDKDRAHANKLLRELSSTYGLSVSQVMLRWAMQRGCAVIPGTGNPGE